ncbi:MAG: rhomboid family intramembrane serine protease [Flavobacteriaceae bacterium]|nr:MAG: rhomboid family intramembrane serine protease [Flavobacteriaceae bacterium]
MSILSDLQYELKKADPAEKLIYINVGLFLVTYLARTFMLDWFTLPTDLSAFMYKPWTVITYAFIHVNLFHILSNLMVLFYIGRIFLDFYSVKQFYNVFFLGVIFGGLSFLGLNYINQNSGAALGGASAGVLAIFVAVATKVPRYALRLRFIGSVELWVLAAVFVLLNVLQIKNIDNGGAIAHLGGALFGFIYAKQMQKNNDIGKWFSDTIERVTNLVSTKNSPLRTVYKSKNKKTTSPRKSTKPIDQRKIDLILDKISKSGYETLSKEEKDFLFHAGKK